MRDYQNKTNIDALPDSNSTNKLGGGEATSLRTENKNAVSRAGLALAPQDGTGEVLTQLAQAMFINGVGASTFQVGGVANAITLTPVTGAAGLLLPPDYSTLDGMQILGFVAITNTAATTFSIGQTGATQFGTKKILNEAGADLSGGELVAGSRFDMVYDASADGGTGAAILKSVSSGPTQSTKAALEAETDEDTYAPPDLLKHSPGIAKAWVRWAANGTILSSYNVSSVVRNSVGNYTVNFTIPFANANYSAGCAGHASTATFLGTDTRTTSSCLVISHSHTGATTETAENAMNFFGDQ